MAKAHAVALGQALVEHRLPDVAEWRVAEVVPQPDRLGQVLVQAQRPRHVAGDPARLERVGQPGAVVVALRRDEDLRLVLESPERLGVDDPVAVALERGAVAVRPARGGRDERDRTGRRAATATPPRAPRSARRISSPRARSSFRPWRSSVRDGGLRRRHARDRDAVRGAAHVIEPRAVEEAHRVRVAAVLAADAELEVGRRDRPSHAPIRTSCPTPGSSRVSNGLRSRILRSM